MARSSISTINHSKSASSTRSPSTVARQHAGTAQSCISAPARPTIPGAVSPTLPPLLALPIEITLEILSYLEAPEPALIVLRRTHSHFRNIIPMVNLGDTLSIFDYRALLVAADHLGMDDKNSSLFPLGRLACFSCLRVLPLGDFSDPDVFGPRRVGGKDRRVRLCVACAIKRSKCREGHSLRIKRPPHPLAWCAGVVERGKDALLPLMQIRRHR